MRNRLYVLLCLLLLQMAACTAVPAAAPVTGPPPAAETRTPIAILPVDTGTQTAFKQPSPTHPAAVMPSATPGPTDAPALPPSDLPEPTPGPSATPVPASAGYRKPWQYFSGAFLFEGPLVYRLRFPIGWYAQREEDGTAVLQNFPLSDDNSISHARIRLEIRAAFSTERGGFPAPNQKLLAAGRPGTRQVLVDSTRGVTVWNVRLYGLHESSAVFQLTGYLSGSPDPAEGVRLLDAMLKTLELYSYPDPLPAPAAPDFSPADTWEQYAGRLDAGPEPYDLRIYFPRGWWAYPEGTRWIDLTNFVLSDAAGSRQAAAPGAIRLSISAEPCADIGGCPPKPGWLNNDMPGTREISQSANGDTLWLVYVYHRQARFTLSAILTGSEKQVEDGILVLNMMLRTLDISP